ncbi:glucosidase 2 subunit beta-like isoform X2 [Electrophorus electricus]|uniref:glucosidase 2 subunit beta-like isoform X2 n=1 Tax=Electrophorus electricus TaxID=8005 RepID=UPI0015D02CA1|nr:glucosidase 2 subunit beta-like isoform X2 [Electrophorus electricus]
MNVNMQHHIVVALIIWSAAFVESKKIRGISMSYKRFYRERKSFLCIDGSKLIPFDRVNDDYCDCADGSDEPGTAACPNGRFYCVNLGFRPHYVQSSRVSDGICDCCDGSDEFSGRIQCLNKCRILGQHERQELEERMKTLNEGWLLKRQLIEEGALVWQEKQAQLGHLQKVAEDLRVKVEVSRKRKLNAEAAKSRLEETVQLNYNRLADEQRHGVPSHGDRVQVEEGRAGVIHRGQREGEIQKVHQEAVKTPSDENGIIKAAQSAVESAGEELQKVEEAYNTVQSEIRELTEKLAIDYGPEREFMFLLSHCLQLAVYEYVYTLCPFSQVIQKNSVGSEVMLGSLGGIHHVTDRRACCHRQSRIRQGRVRAARHLRERQQKWGGWLDSPDSAYSQMRYEHGEPCWQAPERSAVVTLACGTQTELRSVREPSKCHYTMELHTPAACRPSTQARSVHSEL